jgi:hypothetical protein
MTRPDLRRSLRYDVQLPCQAISPFRAFDRLRGVTANMSRNGILLRVEGDAQPRTMPQLGHAARIMLKLPGTTSPHGRFVECLGRVVRIEQRDNSQCVAFEFRRFQFSEGDLSAGSDAE